MITRKTRRGIIVLSVLSGFSFWVTREQTEEELTTVADIDPKFNYVLRDFEIQFFDEQGQPALNMRAPLLKNDPDLELGTIEHPIVKLYQEDAVWDLTAETATVTADKEYIELIGPVNVQRQARLTGDWSELNTEDVSIEVTPQTASTDKHVNVFDGYNHVSGVGMELNMKANTFLLKQQVKATYAIN
jgi:LPS export ABC transporter protein LptC